MDWKDRIASAITILVAFSLVYLAAAYKARWFPFSEEPSEEQEFEGLTLPPEYGDLMQEVEDLAKRERRADRLMAGRLRIDLFFHGSERGTFDPSGCAASLRGGVSRYAGYMQQVAHQSAAQLRVSGGNALCEKKEVERYELPKLRQKALPFLMYYQKMQYAALNVGEFDLVLGADFLLENAQKYGLNFVSANLVSASDGTPLFPPYVLAEAAGVKFAFIGLYPDSTARTTPQKDAPNPLPDGVKVLSAQEVLPPLLDEVHAKGADVVVILSARPLGDDLRLTRAISNKVDFLINSGGFELLRKPTVRNGVVVLASGNNGTHLGQLILYPAVGGKLRPFRYLFEEYDLVEELASLTNRMDELDAEVSRLKRQLEEADDHDEWEKIRQKLVSKENVRKGVYEQMERAKARLEQVRDIVPDASYFWVKLVPIHTGIKPAREIEAMLNPLRELLDQIEEDPRFGGVPLAAGWGALAKEKHSGSLACSVCHQRIYDLWKTTKHAQAYKNLPAEHKHDPTCLVCHTTGWLRKGAIEDPNEIKPEFAAVGCESCHGPGDPHIRKMRQEGKTGPMLYIQQKVPKSLCTTCHNPSAVPKGHKPLPTFDYKRDLAKISCTELAKRAGVDPKPIVPEKYKKNWEKNRKKRQDHQPQNQSGEPDAKQKERTQHRQTP